MVESRQDERAAAPGREIVDVLLALDERYRRTALGLPQQQQVETTWEGVLFTVGTVRLVAALDEVKEVLNYPAVVTPVPGTKPWVRGVANIRGSLLPIFDLQAFLLNRTTVASRRSRVLVIRRQGVSAGVLVGEMVGIRHFRALEQRELPKDVPATLKTYISHAFHQDRSSWLVFNFSELMAEQEFQVAAA